MPPGAKPKAPGTADQRETKFKWQLSDTTGWQHGPMPRCPRNLSIHGQKAWRTWLNSWWASFYTPDDLPGLEMLVTVYDRVMQETLDVTKLVPLLDRYGITPKGRQDLRWAQVPKKPEEQTPVSVQDEIAERRANRRSKLA